MSGSSTSAELTQVSGPELRINSTLTMSVRSLSWVRLFCLQQSCLWPSRG